MKLSSIKHNKILKPTKHSNDVRIVPIMSSELQSAAVTESQTGGSIDKSVSANSLIYWREQVESLLNHKLNSEQHNWKSIYLTLSRYHSDTWLSSAVELDDTELVNVLIEIKVDLSINNNEALIIASTCGNVDILKLLLRDSRVSKSEQTSVAFIEAAIKGHTEVLILLLDSSVANPSYDNDKAIISAATYGHIDSVKILLGDSRVNPSNRNNSAVIGSSAFGYYDIVKLLLKDPRVDPSDQNNKAISLAVDNNHRNVVKLLLGDSRVNPSIKGESIVINAAKEGDIELVKLLLKDDRVIDTLSTIPPIYRDSADDALRGMVLVYYLNWMQLPLHYPKHNNTNEGNFYDKLLRYVIIKRPSVMQIIEYLHKSLIQKNLRKIILTVVNQILEINIEELSPDINWKQSEKILFYSLKALLLVVFKPEYEYLEILNIISNTHESDLLAGALIGAFIGYKKISRQIIPESVEFMTKFTEKVVLMERLP